jgi:hypothetical protein
MQSERRTFASTGAEVAGQLSPADRIAELGEILAVGLIRALGRKSSELSSATGESCLDFAARQSGPEPAIDRENRAA